MKASVIGSGSFGTAVAAVLCSNCDDVRIWGRDEKLVAAINDKHENATYLPGIALPPRLKATNSLEEAVTGSDLIVSATPSHATRDVIGRAAKHLPRHVPI